MNRISKTRFVTLMAAAAGVTAAMATPDQAVARTPVSTAIVSDTVPAKKAAAPKKATTATKATTAAKAPAAAKKPAPAAKAVVSTAAANSAPDPCEGLSEADCRNINGGGY